MRITKVDIPKSDKIQDGLETIRMKRLEQIVLLAGKNGSGKTRILNKILATLGSKPKGSQLRQSEDLIKKRQKNIDQYRTTIKSLNDQLSAATNPVQQDNLKRSIQDHQNNIDTWTKQIEEHKAILEWSYIETTEISEKYTSVHFVPKNLNLDDCNSFNKTQIVQRANAVSQVGTEGLSGGTFAKIQVIQDRWFNATHPKSQISDEEKEQAIKEYEKLYELVGIFLNTSIGRTIDDEATLFGFPLGKSKLSDGQKILLQFCLAIYSQGAALKDLILMMDEPENHLHSSVIIETLDRITECVPNGQIWIATHSIPLLAHYEPSQIWFVENNKIRHAGRIPEKVLASLLGDESEIAKLQDFISLPAQFATSRYAFESLIEPRTLKKGVKDPQSIQIRDELIKLSNTGKIRVLDFGAGKGRIISNLFDLDIVEQQHVVKQLEYIAFDPDNKDKEDCENAISRAYEDCTNRYFNSIDDLLSVYDKESFHVVIMCNVLHEIDPKDWLKLFSGEGTISKLLTNNGLLLLVKDHQIPIGEKAYQKGFLALDTLQLKDLFKISEEDTDFSFADARGDGRLKTHRIPKDCLTRIDENSRLNALKSICLTATNKIIDIREQENNYKNGKIHGFWVQQFANAQLNLDELTTKK